MKRETHLREHISKLEVDGVRLKQENQEQGCLITELTKKTEDDLNTIMDLQQKLVEVEEHMKKSQVDQKVCGSQLQIEDTAAISGHFEQNNQEKSILEEEKQSISSQQLQTLTGVSASGFQQENHCDLLQNNLQSSLHVSSLNDQAGLLTQLVQSLKAEQEELSGCVSSLTEQRREIALSVQMQTEEKQHLTRALWGLKEEKDSISKSLAGLKQEREQLTRTVCGLKDEKGKFIKSVSGLEEEKEQLTKSLSGLEIEKEKLLKSLSSEKEERDQIIHSLPSLQKERDQLSQALLSLKQERDELTNFLECLKEQRDKEQSSYTLQEDCDKLMKSVSTLTEEKERIELSITHLKQEEEQIKLRLQGIREEKNIQNAALSSKMQTEGRNQTQHPPDSNSAVTTKKSETTAERERYSTQRCQTENVQVLRDKHHLSIIASCVAFSYCVIFVITVHL